MEILYAAYGTFMDEERMKTFCPESELVGTGTIRNYRLMFKGEQPFSTATIEDDKGCEVPVIVYKIKEANVGVLDAEFSRWGNYQKTELKALVGKRSAIVVIHLKDEGERLNPPESHYYAAIYECYEKFDFDVEILEEAMEFSDRRIGWV